ncbi:MAG: choline/ethanolamine kinase family protein [Actinomycetota bacterium]|nr:choline/ethanolamine kinase family protein [Actinomycetota bacterium]
MILDAQTRAAELSCWPGPVEPVPVSGGITNSNFLVESEGHRYFVRIGGDIPLHGIMRFNELAASRAAYAAGVSPEVLHHEDGAMVLRFVEGHTLEPEDVGEADTLRQIISLIKLYHREIPKHFRGPALAFWVFQILKDYAHTLETSSSRYRSQLPRLLEAADVLETNIGSVSLVFGHNDLLASNFIDDGERLWLVDWDYAGFNSPLFDLGGLASNNEFSISQEKELLENYFERPVTTELQRRYAAMKCASLLRESMWSMVSEHHSRVEYDYATYTDLNLERFEAAWADFERG